MESRFYPSLFSPSEDEEDTRWLEETKRLLLANPNVITLELLLSVLKQQPSASLVEFLLSCPSSPLVSDHLIPKHGPTPLQVAVMEGCNVDVVKLLIKACPWALCVTNQGVVVGEDPLSLAKILGKLDLVPILQTPLIHGLEEQSSSRQHRCQKRPSFVHQEQEQDLYNVKLLCARLLKRNQQLSKDVKHLQTTINSIQSKKFDDKLREGAREGAATTIEDQKTVLNNRMNQWEIRLEEQTIWNEAMRNHMVGWKQGVEEQLLALQSSRDSICLEGIDYCNENDPPTPEDNNSEWKQKTQHLSNRPKRKCRPFNSIL